VTVDLGTGDGRAVLRAARADPTRLFVGVDADAASMRPAARRAHRAALENAVFVVAAVESLPPDLAAVADHVTISFPWGSLLRGLVGAGARVLPAISRLCRTGATVQAIWSLTARDASAAIAPDPDWLVDRFDAEGLQVVELREASLEEIAATGSSWAKRLGAGRDRPATLLRAVKS
jgi:16S rRNA (adenine(1408)-N(1))-methyltransferase